MKNKTLNYGYITVRLKERGYRLTPQRVMIVSAIEGSRGHISAEEIHAKVAARYPQVDISTVYRTLELLKRLGMIYEIDLGEGRIRYHPEDRAHHHHLVCERCGSVIDVDETALTPFKDILQSEYKFSAHLRHMAVFGLCERCRKKRTD